MKKPLFSGKWSVLGIFLVCGFLLAAADNCEELSLSEQEMLAAQQAQSQQAQAMAQAQAQSQAQQAQAQEQARIQEQARAQEQAQAQQQAQAQANQQQAAEQGGSPAQDAGAGGAETSGTAGAVPVASGAQGGGNTQGQTAAGTQGGAAQSPASGAGGNTVDTAPMAETGGSSGNTALASLYGKEWKLTEIVLSNRNIALDRKKLKSEGAGDLFTLTIQSDRMSGKAAPNRYTTAYKTGDNNTLTLMPVISTLMATSFDPERIQEQDYYAYLSRVKSWKADKTRLELHTTDAGNRPAVLVYEY
jgi:multidrug efflux pump subunit AcrA (membrane-fusion protein)